MGRKKFEKVFVTKSFLPPIGEYIKHLERIWESHVLTNQGPLVQEMEESLKRYLDVPYLHFVSNGTVALQLALNALDIKSGEVITTPFSYVATTSSILWERCDPVFVDIDPLTLCIDANKIERAITKKTKAILAVHVFGFPCDVEKIENIARRNDIKVIYDAAHAFGVTYKKKSLLDYGDVSTCSFHATKLFHTVEGGICVTQKRGISNRMDLAKRFGHDGYEHYQLGINAKNSEFHAAMGLCNIRYLDLIIEARKKIFERYNNLITADLTRPTLNANVTYNYSYYPIIFKSEKDLLRVFKTLEKIGIYPRRYFYPSLNTLPYLEGKKSCPNSENVSTRIACLPLYPGLSDDIVEAIAKALNEILR